MPRSDSFGQKARQHRRKAIACVAACGQDTLNLSGLCDGCKSLIRDGESFRRLKGKVNGADGLGLERAPMVHYWPLYHFRGNAKKDKNGLAEIFRDALLALAGAESEWIHREPRAWSSLPVAKGIECVAGLLRQDSLDYTVVAPSGQIARIQQVYQACVDLMAQAFAEGYWKGDNMLARLADGELSMNDLADKAARR